MKHKRTVILVIDGPSEDPELQISMFIGVYKALRLTTKVSAMELRSAYSDEREQGFAYALIGAGVTVQITVEEAERAAIFLDLPFPPIENQMETEGYLAWLWAELNSEAAEQGRG